MLKIIDEFDLEGLEKFGFTRSKLDGRSYTYTKDIDNYATCFISEDKRDILIGNDGICSSLDIVYDLIQYGIVEKLDGNNGKEMKIYIEFKNGCVCTFDKVKSYEIQNNFLLIKFKNGCVREFDCESIESYKEVRE